MSKLAAFDELLQQYKTFNYHDNPVLAQRLQDVQTWLKERMKETHHDFFNLPEHKLMAQLLFKPFIWWTRVRCTCSTN